MTPTLYEACRRAVHVWTADGTVLRGGRACLFILKELGWRRTARVLNVLPVRWAVECGYALVARNRRVFGRFLFRGEKPDA